MLVDPYKSWLISPFFILHRASVILPKVLQAQAVASLGKVLCRLCLFCWGFVKITWIIVEPGQLPKGVEPGEKTTV